MANDFKTPDVLVRESLMILENEIVAFPTMRNPSHTARFTGNEKVGSSISVRVRAERETREFSGTATAVDSDESLRAITVEKHFYDQIKISADDWTLDLQDFSEQIIEPVMVGFAQAVEEYLFSKYVEVAQFAGTPGDPPDSLADLALVNKVAGQQKIPSRGRIGLIDEVAEADFLNISEVHKANERGDGGSALMEARIGRIMKADWLMSQNVPAHTTGTWVGDTGTVDVDGVVAAGETTMTVANATGSATIKKGDLFTVAGVTGYFVATADVTLALGAGDIPFYPAAPTGGFADNAVITVIASHTANLLFAPGAFTACVFPPNPPQGAKSAVIYKDGLGVRVVYGWDNTALSDVVTFEAFAAAKCLHPEKALRVLG